MLKQRESRLMPQPFSKQDRRVYRRRQNGRGNRLGDVIGVGKFSRAYLDVNLKTCIARLHHQVVVLDLQFVQPFDMNREWPTARLGDRAIQFVVTRDRRQVVERQIGKTKCRQDSGEQKAGPMVFSNATDLRQKRVQLLLHLCETTIGDHARLQVRLEIESSNLSREPRI